ncbi:MAG: endonuclease/exonuclease/phosphatase family protein [Bacteroidota bacterium]|nr:endonuclease/exonuclease/phosphatase family protein [Bacteroidota bacterium]
MFIIKKILYIINILVALCLLLTYLPYHVDWFDKISLLAYAYPFALVLNLCFIVLWLIISPKRHILLSCIVIALHFSFVFRLFNFSKQETKDKEDITILTYNVNEFRHNTLEGSAVQKDNIDSILAFIHRTDPDIICLQDYTSNTSDKKGVHYRLTKAMKYRYYYFYNKEKSNFIRDCAIYSKYHIANAGSILPEHERNYSLIYVDIPYKEKMFRVYNFHLISYKLGPEEKSSYSQIMHGNIQDKEGGKNILKKLVLADGQKEEQIKEILPKIENSEIPYIITGDFNSIPFSKVYKLMTENLADAFVHKGKGIGRTYNGVFPAYRIDYILYKKESFRAKNYSSPNVDFSDHYPVLTTFAVN